MRRALPKTPRPRPRQSDRHTDGGALLAPGGCRDAACVLRMVLPGITSQNGMVRIHAVVARCGRGSPSKPAAAGEP